MYLCYVDESGTSDRPGSTTSFWRESYYRSGTGRVRTRIFEQSRKDTLEGAEIHTGWLLRKYSEQSKVDDFEKLSFHQRRIQVEKLRHANQLCQLFSAKRIWRDFLDRPEGRSRNLTFVCFSRCFLQLHGLFFQTDRAGEIAFTTHPLIMGFDRQRSN